MPLYVGEASGGRILQVGVGLTTVGTNHQGEYTTWELTPAGEMGDCLFRSVGISFTASNGWSLGVTVFVDGVSLGEQAFGGTGVTANGQAQVYCKRRGTRVSVRVRTLTRTGAISFTNAQASLKIIRVWP